MKHTIVAATRLAMCLALSPALAQVTPTKQAKIRLYLDAALKEIGNITDEDQKSVCLEYIARTQAKAGQVPAALQTVERIQNEIARERRRILSMGSALRGIAYAQAKAGDVPAALGTAEKCGKIVGEAGGRDLFALGLVAKAQAEAGDVAGAIRTAETINHTRSKDYALQGVASAQLKAGDMPGALRTAESIKDAKLKADALRTTAPPPPEVVEESAVASRPPGHERCNGYLDMANALLETPNPK